MLQDCDTAHNLKFLALRYFNDTVPSKFSLDLLEKFYSGNCQQEEIIEWALSRPDYFFHELLGICNRNIDKNPHVSPDDRVTQKAAVYLSVVLLIITPHE